MASALLLAAGCASQWERVQKPELDAAARLPEYRIGPEDVIEVAVWKNEAVSRTIPVRPDGLISLPLLNDVQAAGLTPTELRRVLAEKLAAFVPNPEISVIVQQVHSAKVSVFGEVAHPGRYELRGPTTVLEILAHAGGLTPFASRSEIFLLRPRGSGTERIGIDRGRLFSDGGKENVVLRSGDLIFVP
jgi:polysaccharide export outer membrane protein